MGLCMAVMLCSIQSFAYNIVGQVVDRMDNSELVGASITVRHDSTAVVAVASADAVGKFRITNIKDADVWIDVRMIGYDGLRTVISGNGNEDIDLGLVALMPVENRLDEVTVTGTGVIQKPDRYLVFPSEQELERSSSSLSLLSSLQMKMPGLTINEALQSIRIEGRSPVLQINGKEVSMSRILGINSANVLRIEYHDTPDIRYADRGVPGIINFVMRPAQQGGSVMANLSGAFTTGFINAMAGGTYNYKKSEWTLDYSSQWRDYDERYVESSEQFVGSGKPIKRISGRMPGELGYFTNILTTGYTYMHDMNTMLSVTLEGVLMTDAFNDQPYNITETTGETVSHYMRRDQENQKRVYPSADVFFRKQFDKNRKMELDAFASFSKGDFDRHLYDDYEDAADYRQQSRTKNKAWRSGAEAMYSQSYSSFTTKYGVRYYHNYAENRYAENADPMTLSALNTDYVYAYGSIVGRWRELGYSVGVGAVYSHTQDASTSMDAVRPKINVTLNYRLPKNWSLNYLFMYDPSLPSLAQQSETVQTIDEISVRMGNMALKPSSWFRNRIYARYGYKKFTGTFWLSHSRTTSPIFESYRYITDPSSPYNGKFMNQTLNGQHDDRINLQLDLGLQELFGHLSIYGTFGWDRYTLVGFGRVDPFKKVYAQVYGQLYFGNWTISGQVQIAPVYTLSGNVFSRSEQWHAVQVQYRLKNWHFTGRISNPFSKKGAVYKSTTLSEVHPMEEMSYIKNNANMVELGVAYRMNFGQKLNKSERTLKNKGIDTGANY